MTVAKHYRQQHIPKASLWLQSNEPSDGLTRHPSDNKWTEIRFHSVTPKTEVCGLQMCPSAHADLQLFSISMDIRGYFKQLRLWMWIIHGCRPIHVFFYYIQLAGATKIYYYLSLLAYWVWVLLLLLPVVACCLIILLTLSPHVIHSNSVLLSAHEFKGRLSWAVQCMVQCWMSEWVVS